MRVIRNILVAALGMTMLHSASAASWTTHFAYNNVTQIAMTPNEVYALSDGSLYSVNKQSEKITMYSRLSGLHGSGISCIHYDEKGHQLLICYSNGKIDILTSQGIRYISDLYNKDMTQRKNIYNVTIQGRMAYLSTHYGVQTINLRDNKLVDSYWLRPNGQETPIQDVLVAQDSIYAFSIDSLYIGSLKDNLSDYTFWKRELRSGRISPDPDKGKRYVDSQSEWQAGGEEGIVRYLLNTRLTYKPAGPLLNRPYQITTHGDEVWVVPGGRWASQNLRPAVVMHYDGTTWKNVNTPEITAKTGLPAQDFMNIAVDPRDPKHYYATSYGNGVFEFRNDTLVRQYLADDGVSSLASAVPSDPVRYTRADLARYDKDNNLWLITAGATPNFHCIDASGQWHATTLIRDGAPFEIPTPTGYVIDSFYPNYKWVAVGRGAVGVCRIADNGTTWDDTDDQVTYRQAWTDQNGKEFKPGAIYEMKQDNKGHIWICTDLGMAYIENSVDYSQFDAIVLPDVTDNNGENPLTNQPFRCVTFDSEGKIWLGSENLGIYVLNSDGSEIVAHYTTENSAMPSNSLISMSADQSGKVWIGTSEGLVCYDMNDDHEGMTGMDAGKEQQTQYGTMQQWRLHLSYNNATEVVGTPQRIFAIANGCLFSYNRSDGGLEYWNRSTDLNGNTIAHIGYDQNSRKLVVVYKDGRIDLIDEKGNVSQIPDLYIKAGKIAVDVNRVSAGKQKTYLCMPFGIIALNCSKGEVTDTYYIGNESKDINVLSVVELGDSIYAFSADTMYSAKLEGNLADYHVWHASPVQIRDLTNAVCHQNTLYSTQHDSLYQYDGHQWKLVDAMTVSWIHEAEGKLLVCSESRKLYQWEDGKMEGLCDRYTIHDAVYSQGEYWLGEYNWGLIRLNKSGDDYYHPEGPNSNFGYFVHAAHGNIYATIGGRWASGYLNPARVNIFDGNSWRSTNEYDLQGALGKNIIDPVSIAVDRSDPGHYFVATYGSGVIEFRNYAPFKQHTTGNSTLKPAMEGVSADYYTRTDGAVMDADGNLWVMNATEIGTALNVLTPNGQWTGVAMRINGENVEFSTPSGILIDRRDGRYKWMLDQRGTHPGLYLHYDNGTPTRQADDRSIQRSSFVDQNSSTVTPGFFRCLAQDLSNRIWLGTDKGILIIPAETDLFTSNKCQRVIIPRNDGTDLGDYLLGEEQINCIAVDGGNRIWIGTENSGLYLMEDDTITVAHFTIHNSLLPSNTISSIAIHPATGEVFIGTGNGIASYRSDASEPKPEMKEAYAYPNPVRPGYEGMISITGLMDNTTVNIIDAGGNLVCKTRSHGGTAVWDGKLSDGRKATPGVYTALCNANGGHAAVKILVIR